MSKHDELFKYLLSKKDDVAELIQKTLPAELVSRIDLSTLELEATDTVDEQLKELISDIIYNADYIGEGFRTSISIALLFEHKSDVPKHPHLQLLKYIVRMWELNLDQKKPLRVVIPIVVYNGEKKWEYRTLYKSFTEVDDFLKHFIPFFHYLFFDISILNLEMIENLFESVSLRMITAAMNQIYDERKLRESSPDIAKIGEGYIDKEDGKGLAFATINYLLSGIENEETRDIIIAEFNKVIKDGGKLTMTITEKWKAEGEAKGKIEGKIEDAKAMMEEGMSDDVVARVTKLPVEEIQKLRESN